MYTSSDCNTTVHHTFHLTHKYNCSYNNYSLLSGNDNREGREAGGEEGKGSGGGGGRERVGKGCRGEEGGEAGAGGGREAVRGPRGSGGRSRGGRVPRGWVRPLGAVQGSDPAAHRAAQGELRNPPPALAWEATSSFGRHRFPDFLRGFSAKSFEDKYFSLCYMWKIFGALSFTGRAVRSVSV